MPKILFCIVYFLINVSVGKSAFALVEPSKYQEMYLKEEIVVALGQMLEHWQKENYGYLYDNYANSNSRNQIKRREFLQMMNEKAWQPIYQPGDYTFDQLRFVGLSRAFVAAEIIFNHKRNQDKKLTRKILFNLTYEEINSHKAWLVDLFNLVRASF